MQVNATIRPTDHLNIDVTEDRRWLHEHPEGLPAGTLFTSQVERMRAVYTFNSRMFVRTIVQNQRTNRNQNLYSFDVNQHGGSLATQVLFAYKLNWQSVVFVGYGDDRELLPAGDRLAPVDRQFFAKLSYAFQR